MLRSHQRFQNQYLFRICDPSTVVTIPYGSKFILTLLLHSATTLLYCSTLLDERDQPRTSHVARSRSGTGFPVQWHTPHPTQNTVPSLTISIGGPPPDSRLFSLAISRPPFHVALSSTCARVSCSFDKLSLTRIRSAIRSLIDSCTQCAVARWQ